MSFRIIGIVLLLIMFIQGCSFVEVKKRPSKLVAATFLDSSEIGGHVVEISKEAYAEFIQGVGVFQNKMQFTVLPGRYSAVATNSVGKFYQHNGKGIRIKNIGITEHQRGGIFIPYSADGEWFIWTYPVQFAFVPVGAGLVVIPIKSGTNDLFFQSPIDRINVKTTNKQRNTDTGAIAPAPVR